jgi:hypothetical protein
VPVLEVRMEKVLGGKLVDRWQPVPVLEVRMEKVLGGKLADR